MTTEEYNMIQSFSTLALRKMVIKEDAEDLMQDVCLSFLRNEGHLRNLTFLQKCKYVKAMINNKIIDKHRRKTGGGKPRYFNEIDEYAAAIQPEVFSKIEFKDVLEKGKNSIVCESLFALVAGYTNKEIGKAFNEIPNTINRRCWSARIFLRA